jgi:hypothetical protein
MFEIPPDECNTMVQLDEFLRNCKLEHSLLNLVKQRVLQIRGVGFDRRWENPQVTDREIRSEYPLYSDRERAALAWSEAIVIVSEGCIVPSASYRLARVQFSETELTDLTVVINAIDNVALNSTVKESKVRKLFRFAN